MISRAILLIGAVSACGDPEVPARARVLDQIAADSALVLAADARALAHPRFRALVDALRTEVPAGLDCVVDAALTGEAVALGVSASGDATVAIVTKVRSTCAALSQVEAGLWLATLGGGAPARAGSSVLAAPALARARPFLREAPVAAYAVRDGVRLLATASPDPLVAWIALDAADGPAAATVLGTLNAEIEALAKLPALVPITKSLALEQRGSQVVVRLAGAGTADVDLAVAARAVIERARTVEVARAFPCPPTRALPVTACTARPCTTPMSCAVEHDELAVSSLASALAEIVDARMEHAVVNGRVEGVRLRTDLAPYGLRSGDVVIAINGKRLTAIDQVVPYMKASRQRASLMVSRALPGRARRFGTIELVQP